MEQPQLGSFHLRAAAWGDAVGFGPFALSSCLLSFSAASFFDRS